MRVWVILEFRTIWMLHWQTLIRNRIGDCLNTQGGVLGAEVLEKRGRRDVAYLNGLGSLPILA